MASWMLLAFICGLYSVAELYDWASGLSDAPRTVVAALLLSWPVLAVSRTSRSTTRSCSPSSPPSRP